MARKPSGADGTGTRPARVSAAALLIVAGLSGATYASGAERVEPASASRATPATAPSLSRAACVRRCGARRAVRPGSLVRVHGRALGSASRVIFHGGPGRADDASARVRRRGERRILVLVPRDAVTGRISVVSRGGRIRSQRGPRLVIVGRRPPRGGRGPGRPAPSPPAAPTPPASESYAHVRYVAPGGSDSAPGTEAQPWATIAHALAAVGPDTRILVRGGTYVESITAGPDGAPGAGISLESHPGEQAILRAQLVLRGANHVRVHGFVFDGEGASGTAIRVNGGSFVELSHNEVRHYRRRDSSQGFLLDGDTQRPSIVANRVHHTGIWSQHDHGVYCKNAEGAYIANNVIHDLDKGAGIHLYAAEGGGCDGAVITANTIVGNQTSGIVISRQADDNLITGNVITGHSSSGSVTFGHAVTEGEGIGPGNVVRNNLGHDNAQIGDFSCPSCAEVSGNIVMDPLFLNAAVGDFRLQVGSPGADMAHGPDSPAYDRDGTPRPQGPAPDVGAYELRVE